MGRNITFAGILLIVLNVGHLQAQWNQDALKLAQVMDKVSRFYVDSIDDDAIVENTIEHMLHELDPHSSYLSKEELEELSEQLEGEFEGIGVSFNILNDTIFIIRAIAGGPSERVGIQPGDRIVEVEGEKVAGTGITSRDVQRLLKGPKGTRVEVSVLRRGVNGLLDFSITRDKIPVYSVDASYMVNDKIGYVRLARFSHTSIEEFESAVRSLKQEGMKDLILDLSDNGGGWLPVAVELSDHFLSGNKEIVRTEGDKVEERIYRARKPGLFEEGNLVIMIDGSSASASEIVSGAIQDWDRGVIVGRRSFGKGLVQQPFYLTDGSMIRLTVARYYTPTGRLIQKPYEEGYDEYTLDLINRYNSGELLSEDSIKFPESQRYKTLLMHRTVYGGGGIMPDYFVPIDTTGYTAYYSELARRGILARFAHQYLDDHRDAIRKAYPDFKAFDKKYQPSDKEFEQLLAYAGDQSLEFNQEEWEVSREHIGLLLKGYMAQDLYGTGAFYEVINPSNNVFNKAVQILEHPELHHEKLAKVE
ncbi:MAG: S41 family peptidase [Bacteroidales bacterium]